MNHSWRRLARLHLAALLSALLLTGCGQTGGDGGGSGGEGDAASDDKLTSETAMDALKAAYDESRTAHLELVIEGSGQKIEAEGVLEVAESTTDMALEMTIPGQGELDMRVLDEVVYVQTPATGEKFLEVDINDPSDPMAQQFSQLADSSGLDSTFDAFDAGLREVEFVESTTIDGDEVDRYTFTVDTAAALKAQGQPTPEGMPEQLDYDVFLDSEDRFRRVDLEVAGVATRIDIDQWGEPVEIEKPSADQIAQPPAA